MDNQTNSGSFFSKLAAFARGHRTLLIVLAVLLALAGILAFWLSTPPAVPDKPEEDLIPQIPLVPAPGSKEPEGSGQAEKPEEPEKPPRVLTRKEGFYTFLVAGTSDGYNTDTILVGGIDVKTHKVTIMSVPRDTMVNRDIKYRKINNAYGRKGIDELRLELEEVTGVYPDFYGVLNYNAFKQVVDLVGGVEFYVPYDMYHEDGITVIDLKEGWQTLDGDHALQLVRFRGTRMNDFGRTQVQRDFIAALLEQVTKKLSLSTVTGIVDAMVKNVKTNMPAKDILWFYTNVVSKMDMSTDLVMTVAPIEGAGKYLGQDYVYLDPQGVADMVNGGISPYNEELIPADLNIVNLKDEEY